MKLAATTLVVVSVVLGADLPATQIRGNYIEARNADVYTGPCFANSEVNLVGDLAVFGWQVSEGLWKGVRLNGLSVVGVIRASGTLGYGHRTVFPVKSVLIIDEKANPEQRLALKNFAQTMSDDLLADVQRVEYRPISLTFENDNPHSVMAKLTAGELAAIQTRPIQAGDHLCANELVWYPPLVKVDHAMPAYALAHNFRGKGLDTIWSSPEKRSAFVGTFHYTD
jgi:hypothetical protein